MTAAEGVQTTILPIGKDMGEVALRFNRMQNVHKETHNVGPFFVKKLSQNAYHNQLECLTINWKVMVSLNVKIANRLSKTIV